MCPEHVPQEHITQATLQSGDGGWQLRLLPTILLPIHGFK